MQSQYWFRSSFKPFFLHNRLCVRSVICKHSKTYLCLSGENYWDMVFSGFVHIKVLFITNKAAWWRTERYFSCNLTCNYLGKPRPLIYCFRCIHTCIFICQKEQSLKVANQTNDLFLFAENILAGLLLAKNMQVGLKFLLCKAWTECTSRGVISTGYSIPNLPFPLALHVLQKASLACLGFVRVSEDHSPLEICHRASPTLSSLISVAFPVVTHSEQCRFSAMASPCEKSPAFPHGLHVGVHWTCPEWCQGSKLGR